MSDIKDKICQFDKCSYSPNHRFNSWEHCYAFFARRTEESTDEYRDYACLHLAFYLASWGMYRGSSAILWKDYKIHQDAVDIILSEKYDFLYNIGLDIIYREKDLLFELICKIKECYDNIEISATNTLITKILLGTLGCIPAYDRFFISGIKDAGLPYSYLNEKNFKDLLDWVRDNKAHFDEVQKEINKKRVAAGKVEYPLMKLVDMYFWMQGFKKELEEEKDENKKECLTI